MSHRIFLVFLSEIGILLVLPSVAAQSRVSAVLPLVTNAVA